MKLIIRDYLKTNNSKHNFVYQQTGVQGLISLTLFARYAKPLHFKKRLKSTVSRGVLHTPWRSLACRDLAEDLLIQAADVSTSVIEGFLDNTVAEI